MEKENKTFNRECVSNLSNCWTNCEEKTQLDGCRLESFQA